MSKLEQIQTLITVVEENGFAAAARTKGVTTAAVSRQIAALERELGVQLLQRTTRKLALTAIGAEYFQQCKKTLFDLHEAEHAILASKKVATGVLQVIAPRYFAATHLLPRLHEFMRLNPKLQIHLQLEERIPVMDEETVDIIFGVSYDGPADWIRKRVATTRYILCAAPGYLRKHGYPQSPHDLSRHHYITHSGRVPDNIITFKDNQQIHVNPTLWLNDSFAMRECALRDMGLVNLHDYIVNDEIEQGKLIEILRDQQEPKKNIYLYYQQSRYVLPKIRRFIDFYTSTDVS